MSYEIRTKEVPDHAVATMRMHTSLTEIPQAMRATLNALATHVTPKPSAATPFAIFYNEPFKPDDIDVEMGIAIDRDAAVDTQGGVRRRVVPTETIAYTVHVGSYATIGKAYTALFDWLRKTGHRPIGAPREIYVVGPDEEKSSALYVTELEVPIA